MARVPSDLAHYDYETLGLVAPNRLGDPEVLPLYPAQLPHVELLAELDQTTLSRSTFPAELFLY